MCRCRYSKMKTVAVFLVAILVAIEAIEDSEVLQKWQKFKADHSKVFGSAIESEKRSDIFKTNLIKIESHNNLFKLGKVSYEKGINQFSDWSEADATEKIRCHSKKTNIGNILYNKTKNFNIPAHVDWREKGAVTDVMDQRLPCQSCWTFSSTGSIEGQLAIHKSKLITLSKQNLIDCSWEYGNQGCDGGLSFLAFNYIKDKGVESNADYPYQGISSSCRANPSKVVTKISNFVRIPKGDENALTEAIATIGPIAVSIHATGNFLDYKSGIFEDKTCSSDPTMLNHEMLAVGYGSENGKDYYIVKNSYGVKWGESGYVKMPRNQKNKCGIANDPLYPVL